MLFSTSTISKVSVFTRGSRGYHERSVVEKNKDVQEVNNCIEANKGRNVMGRMHDAVVSTSPRLNPSYAGLAS